MEVSPPVIDRFNITGGLLLILEITMSQHEKIKIILNKIKARYLKENGNVMSVGEYLDFQQKMKEIKIFIKSKI